MHTNFTFRSIQRWNLLLLLFAVTVVGCGEVRPNDSGSDASNDPLDGDVGCREAETRCLNLQWQTCTAGVWLVTQTCEEQCHAITGCGNTPTDECKVVDDLNAVPACDEQAPPDSFEPAVQWTWNGHQGEVNCDVTPLVANLTDDDENGAIDLCDVPDVLVVVWEHMEMEQEILLHGYICVLNGEDGALHRRFDTEVDGSVTPAIGDIDADGMPEVMTLDTTGHLIAFEHDGTVKWTSSVAYPAPFTVAVALADLDNDGDVEILVGNMLWDHLGNHLWTAPVAVQEWVATTAADLDGDGDLEVVLGNAAYHHDGSEHYYTVGLESGFPQIANLDGDPEPEVLVTNESGIALLNHDGSVIFQDLRPTNVGISVTNWVRPATVHDFDGDGVADFALSSAEHYTIFRADASIIWSATVSDISGIAAGTAFDFLGDGIAEAMYADENNMYIFGGSGEVLLQTPRSSGTLIEYPVVADVDDDGSAEIVVVSDAYFGLGGPTVQVIRDVDDRWIQARRIWNQHAYHVTNVREDATIPQFQLPHWEHLNTFRTNAQIEGGGICQPIVD